MTMRRTITRPRRLGLVLVILALPGCESPIPRVDSESPPLQGRSPTELTELELGRSTYIAKCSGCHALVRPTRGNAEFWRRQVEEMAERSCISSEERERILDYLALVCLPGPDHVK